MIASNSHPHSHSNMSGSNLIDYYNVFLDTTALPHYFDEDTDTATVCVTL